MTDDEQVIERKLLELAFAFHVSIEGEYGCPGATCPGVQRLAVAFAALKGVGQSHPQVNIEGIRRLINAGVPSFDKNIVIALVAEVETQRANVKHLLDTCVPVQELNGDTDDD
jgi:hypothetical protein